MTLTKEPAHNGPRASDSQYPALRPLSMVIRQARPSDAAAMHRVRMSVQENRLTSVVLSERDYVVAIEERGRGWVVENRQHEGRTTNRCYFSLQRLRGQLTWNTPLLL
jgi:hypothetical protein